MKNRSELCCNLWAVLDLGTQVIYGLAGKTYSIEGTEDEKLSLLRKLSAFDYQTVETIKLPDRFSLKDGEGQIKKGATTIQAFNDKGSGLFSEMIDHLESMLPKIADYSEIEAKFISQKLSGEPLCVSTLICEDETGNRRAIVNDDDRQWLEEIAFGWGIR